MENVCFSSTCRTFLRQKGEQKPSDSSSRDDARDLEEKGLAYPSRTRALPRRMEHCLNRCSFRKPVLLPVVKYRFFMVTDVKGEKVKSLCIFQVFIPNFLAVKKIFLKHPSAIQYLHQQFFNRQRSNLLKALNKWAWKSIHGVYKDAKKQYSLPTKSSSNQWSPIWT